MGRRDAIAPLALWRTHSCVKYRDILYTRSQDILYTEGARLLAFLREFFASRGVAGAKPPAIGASQPVCASSLHLLFFNGMRCARLEIELADQSATKPDHNSMLQELQLHVLPNEGAADEITLSPQAHASVFPHFANMRWIGVLPRLVFLLESTQAGLPAAGRHVHL